MDQGMDGVVEKLLETVAEHLKNFERDTVAQLTRMEENLRLLRHELLGDGQPGRISRIEADVSLLRAEYHRQRGVFAALSLVISAGMALLFRLFIR